MPVHCADCDQTFLISPDGETHSGACPHCGGTRLERDQPSPTHSDGDLRNMVDPSTGLDQGGNPNQEGIWATTDGGWQNHMKRDESFASVRTAMDFNFDDLNFGRNPLHTFAIDQTGRVHSLPAPATHEQVADQHQLHELGFPKNMSLGVLHDDNSTEWYQHHTGHSPEAMASMLYGHFGHPVTIDPTLKPSTNEERWGIQPGAQPGGNVRELERLYAPASPRSYGTPRDNEGLVRGGSRTLNMEPYDPWTHESTVKVADEPIAALEAPPQAPAGPQHTLQVTPGPQGIHNGTLKWLAFLDAHINGQPVRGNTEEMNDRWAFHDRPEFGQPVTVAVHHPAYLPVAAELISTSATAAGTPKLKELAMGMQQGIHPAPPGVNPSRFTFGSSARTAAILPLLGGAAEAIGAGGAASALMRGALMGTGSQAVKGLLGMGGEQQGGASMPPPAPRPAEALARVADAETPTSNPGYFHDDPEKADTQEFNDGSTSPNQDNPNLDDSGASGEDPVRDHAGFGPNSAGLERLKLLAPLALHYYHSDESGAADPLLRELHEQLEAENPGYLDQGDEEALAQAFEHIKKNPGVHAGLADVGNWVKDNVTTPVLNGVHDLSGQPTDDGRTFRRNYEKYIRQGLPDGEARQRAYVDVGTSTPQELEKWQLNQIPTADEKWQLNQIPTAQMGWDDPRNAKTAAPGVGMPVQTGPNMLNAPQNAVPTQAVPGPVPQTAQQGTCPFCGGTQTADGTCPQCGAKVNPMGGATPGMAGNSPMPYGGHPGGPQPIMTAKTAGLSPEVISLLVGAGVPATAFGLISWIANNPGPPRNPHDDMSRVLDHEENDQQPPSTLSRVAADHQGPVTDEQVAAVQQLLVDTGRAEECPNVVLNRPAYADELAQVANKVQNPPPAVNPDEQPPQPPMPAQEVAPPGATMPMPGMSVPGGQGPVARVAADNLTPKCPKCDSHTTGLDNADGDCHCHACGNTWNVDVSAKNPVPTKTAADPNVETLPAADHTQRLDDAGDTDSSHTWQTDDGQPLEEGAEYEMHNPSYKIPDIVKIIKKKPDGLIVSTIGQFSNDGSEPTGYQHEITKEEADLEGLTFVPSGDSNAGDQSLDQYADSAQAPVNTVPDQAVPPTISHVEVDDDACPKCASSHITSSLSSPTTEFHECYKCGHGWETKDDDYGKESNVAAWLLEDSGPGGDDFHAEMERHQAMRSAGQGSRSIGAIAQKDTRLQAIKQTLNANAAEKTAGKKFTPREQREFIDEDGVARNADKLELGGTHYEAHELRDVGSKANGMNVPDSHMFMGI